MKIIRGDNSQDVGSIHALLIAISLLIAFAPSEVTSLPNIRIQVNNDNLQNPPYLLDAVKEAEKQESTAALTSVQGSAQPGHNEGNTEGSDKNVAQAAGNEELSSTGDKRDSTFEETVNIESSPASKMASSDGSSQALRSSDSSADVSLESSDIAPGESTSEEFKQEKVNRNFQLDVTSSHLKRPAVANSAFVDEDLSEAPSSSSSSSSLPSIPTGNSQAIRPVQAAQSVVSPSVSSEDSPQTGKNANSPPDVWEPSQVMQGVTNASLVPATVRRHYGHQTRTRITLGGGYQRDQQQDSGEDSNKPASDSSGLSPAQTQTSSASMRDNSRVIEIPQKIVLPASVFTKQQALNETTGGASQQVGPKRRDTRCPANGMTTLEHPAACDRYYLCENGYSSEQVCPNGLMYGTRDVVRDYCVHRWQVVCGDKSIPNPISSPGCRWQNGIFNVQGSPKCTPDFYECIDGSFEVKKCTISGQVYDDKTKSCRYAEQVGCAEEALSDFQCPTDDQSNTYWPFPRYFLNERALIHCISDKPQIVRCRDHERVDPEHLFCVPIDKSAAPVNEDGSPAQAEVEARRVATTSREKGKKVQKAQKATS